MVEIQNVNVQRSLSSEVRKMQLFIRAVILGDTAICWSMVVLHFVYEIKFKGMMDNEDPKYYSRFRCSVDLCYPVRFCYLPLKQWVVQFDNENATC